MADSTFPELFARVVAQRADHPALVTSGEVLTYRELDRRSGAMARALLARGAGKGTRIGVLAPDGPLWLTTFYAALRIGALVTPISTLATPHELAQILRMSDAQLLVGARRYLKRDYAADLTKALPELVEGAPGGLRLLDAPHLRSIWLDDAEGVGWAEPVEQVLALADAPGAPDADLLAAVEAEVSSGDDAFVVFTSGSTAHPKAVVHSQHTVAQQPGALAPYFLLGPEDRTLCLLPAFWMGGIGAALQVLSTGGTLLYPATPHTDDVLDIVEKHDVTYMVVWHKLVALRSAAQARGIDVDRIRGLREPIDGQGTLIPPGRKAALLGMSETFGPHSGEPINHVMPESKLGSNGRGVNGIERRVVDPESGAEVGAGEVGELHLRGGGLMTGFYKTERRQVFTPDGFYPTGDLVRMDEDGYVWFVGRTGDMIKTNSANVSRLEVEAALNALPEVEQSFVAGLPDPQLGEAVAAAVVAAPDMMPTEDGLRSALRERLSSFKVPRRIVFIGHEDVPRTATGKVQLFELAELITSRTPSQE